MWYTQTYADAEHFPGSFHQWAPMGAQQQAAYADTAYSLPSLILFHAASSTNAAYAVCDSGDGSSPVAGWPMRLTQSAQDP